MIITPHCINKMPFSKKEKQELLAKFYAMDSDRNGVLTKAEIEECLLQSKLPKSVEDTDN